MRKKRSSKKLATLAALENQYRSIASTAETFRNELSHQICKLLNDNQIILGLPIESRVKKWESITDKITRLSMNLHTIVELNDLVGLRLLFIFQRDLLKATEILSNTFTVLQKYDTQDRLKEDQFGYSSVHLVIELPASWLALPTLASMADLKAELQVRTVAQHVWAAASHVLQYKQEASVPLPILRSIYRVSALLETVDLEFERVLDQRDTYRMDIDIRDEGSRLNVDLLEKILDSELSPANKTNDEDYSELLGELIHFKIEKVGELRTLIRRQRNAANREDAIRVSQLRKMDEDEQLAEGGTPERTAKGVFYTHVGLLRIMMSKEFPQLWSKYQEDQLLQSEA